MKTKCSISVGSLNYFGGEFKDLIPNSIYKLIIDYPLDKPFVLEIQTSSEGVSFFKLLNIIHQSYIDIYNNADEYGVWGHGIHDLWLEGIEVDHTNKVVNLIVGS